MKHVRVENVSCFEEWAELEIEQCNREISKLNAKKEAAMFSFWNHYRNAYQQSLLAYQYFHKTRL